jgi:AcrR family transcriptional regulator
MVSPLAEATKFVPFQDIPMKPVVARGCGWQSERLEERNQLAKQNRDGRPVYAVHILVYSVHMADATTSQRITAKAQILLDKEGHEAVTMRRVAQAVGITAMALYRHFPDRAGLLNALADAGFDALAARLQAAPHSRSTEKRLTAILDVYIDFALEKPRLFELMFLTQREGARQFPADFKAELSPTANIAKAAFEEGMRNGIFRKDDTWEITFETGAMMQGMVMLYLGGRLGMKAEDFRAFCHRSFRRYFRGIRK